MKSICSFYFLLFLQVSCISQSYTKLKIPSNYKRVNSLSEKFVGEKIDSLNAKAFQLSKALPENFNTQGKVDYTAIIQDVLNNNVVVNFPNCPLLINSTGLTLKSNSTLLFPKNSKLVAIGNNLPSYEILRIHDVSNLSLYAPTIIGERDLHTSTKGEWGMGISIRGSEDVKVYNATISNCWGDGIYIGSGKGPNINIVIENASLDNNRRNGISVISAINLQIISPLISNTNGINPMAGIDIEPNTNGEELQNINIINAITFNNKNRGILLALNNFYGHTIKDISINILNHTDDQSGFAIGMSLDSQKDLNRNSVQGRINIKNSLWKKSKISPIQFYDLKNDRIKVDFTNSVIDSKSTTTAQMLGIKLKYKDFDWVKFK
ncbi:right-handed parallel beta-helix repeat-containing protein [Flavobacterium sp. 14A]|uniref:right-handed parallel beta-helix repeat-containing protein n=1 Tax=Flavobacterium sp. 14A TaxID=2735896 RepID=UPI00156EFB6F|nr:right-handed parallel beta-helix repeat-containing protein [Flavobacterium sp. 14A]NRT10967.1 hypothetical protein [Flavobacterium sp. 14A]